MARTATHRRYGSRAGNPVACNAPSIPTAAETRDPDRPSTQHPGALQAPGGVPVTAGHHQSGEHREQITGGRPIAATPTDKPGGVPDLFTIN